ncbi:MULTISPECIES: hypothetical protein [Mycobacterium]|jgi:hypothetical protein|uniref:Transmembrane protein n=1 Tax=Mycobacterium gordonae TaxID=1778 RepID=A0A1A6B9T0_MYCGO|nr:MULTISPECIES: hypothetical protein [Mycobacterium]MBI2701568.1 hypothetical protein [Mycobacterium sp.]MBX9983367.1 hypothetical protein [Mycobacterium gordonae]MCQ4360441.1 hypothetical protein [Mycobacterium gordonae]MCV7010388.1 hypothetical protein [Mycobacterium gordonae]OBR99116.1 hypothetical protein A9W98_32025 [Mycobacterium gordonae]
MNGWFNYEATGKILVFSLLAGAALPGLFALGVRLQAVASGSVGTSGLAGKQRPLLTAVAWLIYAVVLVVVVLGVLYIARDFIAHHTHYPFLGAKP